MVAGLSAVAALAGVVFLAVALGGGTARGNPEPTPTPMPDLCEDVCLEGLWHIDYTDASGAPYGHCTHTMTQSGPSDLWGEVSCTHNPLGSFTGTLTQATLWADFEIEFRAPTSTVGATGRYTPDGGETEDGTWNCVANCDGHGTYAGRRIESYYQGTVQASGLELTTELQDVVEVPPEALPEGATVTASISTLPAAPPAGLQPLSRAYTLTATEALQSAVTLKFKYDQADLGGAGGELDPSTLRVYVYDTDTQTWDLLGGDVDTEAQIITIQVTHFSVFAAFGSPLGVLVQDGFDDGDFTHNPSWTDVSSQGCAPSPGIIEVDSEELHIRHSGAGGCGNAAQIQIDLDVPLEGRQAVVSFDVMPIYSSVVGGTGQDNSEWPARVWLEMETEGGGQKTLLIGYNYRGGFSQDKVWGYVVGFGNVPQDEWQRNQTFTLQDYIPDATRLLWILVGGAGWDYESRLDNISLMLEEAEPPTATPTATATATPTASPTATSTPTPTSTPGAPPPGGGGGGPVGGTVDVWVEDDGSRAETAADSSAGQYAALAAGAAALAAGGWYARRRWLR